MWPMQVVDVSLDCLCYTFLRTKFPGAKHDFGICATYDLREYLICHHTDISEQQKILKYICIYEILRCRRNQPFLFTLFCSPPMWEKALHAEVLNFIKIAAE